MTTTGRSRFALAPRRSRRLLQPRELKARPMLLLSLAVQRANWLRWRADLWMLLESRFLQLSVELRALLQSNPLTLEDRNLLLLLLQLHLLLVPRLRIAPEVRLLHKHYQQEIQPKHLSANSASTLRFR